MRRGTASRQFWSAGQRDGHQCRQANFQTGWTGVASLGWGFGNGFRAEIEGYSRTNEVDSIRDLHLAPSAEPAACSTPMA